MGDTQEMTFPSVEERDKAISEFDETTGSEDELDRIMNAKIEESSEEKPEKTGEPPEEKPAEEKPTEEKPDEDKPSEEKPTEEGEELVLKFKKSDLPEGMDSPGKLLKKLAHGDETIQRQTQFIKEKLQNQAEIPNLTKRLEVLERENAQLKEGGGQPKKETQRRVEVSESKLEAIKERRRKLNEKFPDIEARVYEPDYVKANEELNELMVDEIGRLNSALYNANLEIGEAKNLGNELRRSSQQQSIREQNQTAYQNELKEVTAFAEKHQEFNPGKPIPEVDKDYRKWRDSIASIYWGRKPQNEQEYEEALTQLRRESPDLVAKCQAAGVDIEPNQEMQRYLALCEMWDSWQGIRPDPLTGEYRRDKNGNIAPLVRYDASVGGYVPDRFPTIEDAYASQRVKSGYYTNKILEAHKQGGKEALAASQRRDSGAVELDNETGAGKQKPSKEAALQELMGMNEQQVIMTARSGDTKLLDRYNELAKIVGMPEVETPAA